MRSSRQIHQGEGKGGKDRGQRKKTHPKINGEGNREMMGRGERGTAREGVGL